MTYFQFTSAILESSSAIGFAGASENVPEVAEIRADTAPIENIDGQPLCLDRGQHEAPAAHTARLHFHARDDPPTGRTQLAALHRLVYLAAIPVAVHFILPSCG